MGIRIEMVMESIRTQQETACSIAPGNKLFNICVIGFTISIISARNDGHRRTHEDGITLLKIAQRLMCEARECIRRPFRLPGKLRILVFTRI